MRKTQSWVIGLLLLGTTVHAQTRSGKQTIKRLKADIEYLASDALEGRRTGTDGERKAVQFLESRYKAMGIAAWKGNYQYPFQFVYGKEVLAGTEVTIENVRLTADEAFPMPFSGNADRLKGEALADVFEQSGIWIMPLYADADEAKDAHFDYEKVMFEKAKEAKKQGALAVLFYDGYGAKYPPAFNPRSDFESLELPIVFLTKSAFERHVQPKEHGVTVQVNINIGKAERTGTNVAAYIDNKAPYTVVLGAHFDHLGYGEDGNSRATKTMAGKKEHTAGENISKEEKAAMIHNGADDNASGTAGVLELAARIKKKKNRKYNYLFLHFSGEELGLLGSKAIVKEMQIDSSNTAYMINMDMIGRLNDSTHTLTVGGVGTSPSWGQFVTTTHKRFKFQIDSSGVGPSDHTSFYNTGIPVLFFFTGIHHDYHKPSDDADKINYLGQVQILDYAQQIIDVMETQPKPNYTRTKQNTAGKVRFKVTLGIMPDYSYQDAGVKVDGVTEDRPAIKAGIKAGDIVTQLGEHKIQGMQSYMEALSKFKPGQTIDVTIIRNGTPVKLTLTF